MNAVALAACVECGKPAVAGQRLCSACAPVAVDATAVLTAVESVLTHRISQARKVCDRALRNGMTPHPDAVMKFERAEYLRAEVRELRAALAELTWAAASELARGTPTYPERLRAAVARVQGGGQ